MKRHLQYLVAIRALSLSKERVDGRLRRIFRLEVPPGAVVVSQKDFRVEKGMSEYAYVKKHAVVKQTVVEVVESDDPPELIDIPEVEAMNTDNEGWDEFFAEKPEADNGQKQPVFSQKPEEKLSGVEDFFAEKEANFAPILNSNTKLQETKQKEHPPKVPPRTPDFGSTSEVGSGSTGALRAPEGPPNSRRPLAESLNGFPDGQSIFLSSKTKEEQPEAWDEPLLEKKKIKRPRTERERRADAAQKSNKGHIVNPIGVTDNRKRIYDWKKPCDIEAAGSVTRSQLWRHLHKHYEAAFSSDIEMQMSADRRSVDIFFEDIQAKLQKFYKEADLRTVAEYFDWYFAPQQIQVILKEFKRVGTFNVRQLCGEVGIRIFADKVLNLRQLQKMSSERPSEAETMKTQTYKIWKEFEGSMLDQKEFCRKIVKFGFALAAQYLFDEQRHSESECRQRIITTMASFIKEADKAGPEALKATIEYLCLADGTTESYASHLTSEDLWFEWKQKTNDLIEVAIEQAGVNINVKDYRGKQK